MLTFSSRRTGPVFLLKREVAFDRLADTVALDLGRLPDEARGNAEHERVRRDSHSLRAHRARTHDRAAADLDTVEQYRAHRDEGVVRDRRPMDDRPVPDPDSCPDRRGNTVIHVDDRAVL